MKKFTYLRLIIAMCFWSTTAAFAHGGHFKEMHKCMKISDDACTAIAKDNLTAFKACMKSFRSGVVPEGVTLSAEQTSTLDKCKAAKEKWQSKQKEHEE